MDRVYRALADPTRRRVLALLRERDMTAGELAAQFELSWPTMSGHFAVLREADLVSADREGSTIRYHLNVSVLEEAMLALMDAFGIDPARNQDETRSKRVVRSSTPAKRGRPKETR